jgi:hypothetical protein
MKVFWSFFSKKNEALLFEPWPGAKEAKNFRFLSALIPT